EERARSPRSPRRRRAVVDAVAGPPRRRRPHPAARARRLARGGDLPRELRHEDVLRRVGPAGVLSPRRRGRRGRGRRALPRAAAPQPVRLLDVPRDLSSLRGMSRSLLEDSAPELQALRAANDAFGAKYPGERRGRQPVHTFYGAAQFYAEGAAQALRAR